MVRAVGFSHNDFNPHKPGRLCRGRERWIEPWSVDEPGEPIQRLVISGALFEDDSARDAMRGVTHAGLDFITILTALYPRREFLAFTEDGHPADIPEDAENVELYETHLAGGRETLIGVRWTLRISGVKNLRALLDGEGGVECVRGFVVLKKDTDIEPLLEPLFLLVGMSTLDSPPARFQPLALPEVLDQVEAVVLIHRDKHGHAVGVYTREPIVAEKKLRTLTDRKGVLLIPFAIPPMLARWDRALAEARSEWNVEEQGEFPVPASDRPYSWDRRRRPRRRKGDGEEEAPSVDGEAALENPSEVAETPPVEEALEPTPPLVDLDEINFDDFLLEE